MVLSEEIINGMDKATAVRVIVRGTYREGRFRGCGLAECRYANSMVIEMWR